MNNVQKKAQKKEKEMKKMDAKVLEKFQVEELEKRYETVRWFAGGAYGQPGGGFYF